MVKYPTFMTSRRLAARRRRAWLLDGSHLRGLLCELVSRKTNRHRLWLIGAVALVCAVVLSACGGEGSTEGAAPSTAEQADVVGGDDAGGTVADGADPPAGGEASDESDAEGVSSSFVAEVWADNWFALYVNGELVAEDSVPITTERSFNAETISFEATYPLTIAIEAKDFKETDSGIEYIGEPNQQMGDGGLIAQITDKSSGEVITVTDAQFTVLVIHRAPLNTGCEKDADPDTTCESEITDAPSHWATPGFDDSSWSTATEWSESDVGPKDGYDEISWDTNAELIWGSDLEIDNTILLRHTVSR